MDNRFYAVSVNYNCFAERRYLADAKAIAIEEAGFWKDDAAYIEICKGPTMYISYDSGKTWQKFTRKPIKRSI